jgi:hypothetical protein
MFGVVLRTIVWGSSQDNYFGDAFCEGFGAGDAFWEGLGLRRHSVKVLGPRRHSVRDSARGGIL